MHDWGMAETPQFPDLKISLKQKHISEFVTKGVSHSSQ